MIEARRRAYLEAMGFDVWVSRTAEQPGATGAAAAENAVGAAARRLRMGPGESSTLVVCAEAAEGASRFAGDLARALGGTPVWAWPEDTGEALPLDEAIRARLITRVVLLGPELAERLCGAAAPAVIGSAALIVAARMEELAVSGAAKQALWAQLSGRSEAARGGRQ